MTLIDSKLTAGQQAFVDAWVEWFSNNVKDMIPEDAARYAELLVSKKVTTVDRLERALSKNSSYMTDIGIDSTDAEDILEALNNRKQAPDTNTTAKATNTTAPLPAAEAAVATPPATLAPAATSGKCQTSCHTLLTYQSK
jgi:type 1 fimbria pilin